MHVISFRKANSREVKRHADEKNRRAPSRPDDENPERTREDFKRAQRAPALIGEIFGPETAEAAVQRRGRP